MLTSGKRTLSLSAIAFAVFGFSALGATLLPASVRAQTAVETMNAVAASSAEANAVAAGAAPASTASPASTGTAIPAAAGATPAPGDKLTTITTSNGTTISVPAPEAPKVAIDEPFAQSLFLTPEDLVAIERALKGVVSAGSGSSGTQEIPQVRKIVLSGVSYKSPNDWVVWINGQKIVPGLMLKEIVDIKVERDLVHLKWFDIGLNGVLNITLRPHDTYDIVTGVLLPG